MSTNPLKQIGELPPWIATTLLDTRQPRPSWITGGWHVGLLKFWDSPKPQRTETAHCAGGWPCHKVAQSIQTPTNTSSSSWDPSCYKHWPRCAGSRHPGNADLSF